MSRAYGSLIARRRFRRYRSELARLETAFVRMPEGLYRELWQEYGGDHN